MDGVGLVGQVGAEGLDLGVNWLVCGTLVSGRRGRSWRLGGLWRGRAGRMRGLPFARVGEEGVGAWRVERGREGSERAVALFGMVVWPTSLKAVLSGGVWHFEVVRG